MFPVPAAPLIHLVLETLGVILAMAYYRRRREHLDDSITDRQRFSLLLAAAIGALIGSRLIGALEVPELFLNGGGELGWLYYIRSKTIVGGLMGGLLAVEITKKIIGVHQRSGDLYVVPLIIAMAVGRIGCFVMGVQEPTFGIPTEFWTAIDLGDGIPRHPTALYEIAFLGLLDTLLRLLPTSIELRPGRLFMLFLSGYLLYRLCVGFIQPAVARVGGLSLIQWTCVCGLLWYVIDELYSRSRKNA